MFYDADGNGAGAQVKFGVVANLSTVAASDFLIV